MNISVLNKLLSLNKKELDIYFKNTLELRQEIKRSKKMKLVNKARDLYAKKYSMIKIAEILALDRRTVKKYVDSNFTPIVTHRSTKKSILDPYKDDIFKLYQNRNTCKAIYNSISEKGYKGSQSNLRHYCSNFKKQANNMEISLTKVTSKVRTVKRSVLLKILYKPVENIKELSDEVIKLVNKRYPFFEKILNLLIKFKEILKQKKVEKLDGWLIIAKTLNNSYINSFINGISRDVEAVKNAIIYDYNNVLAEGSVNKLKVIKRIMYGRNNFEMLRNKVLYLKKNK
jgi:predicted transcriptional regulator